MFVIVVLLSVNDSSGFAPKFTDPGLTLNTRPAAVALAAVGGDDKRDKNDPYESQFVYLL